MTYRLLDEAGFAIPIYRRVHDGKSEFWK